MSRLEPIIGVEIIDDIRLGQIWHEVSVIKELIDEQKPKHFIEIGVHEGGLSYVLIPYVNCYYTGIEIDCPLIRSNVIDIYTRYANIATLMCLDCFDPAVYQYIAGWENKIVYCDGGNKAREIAHFQSACSPGDIIMCHDFWDGTRKVRGVPDENVSKEVLSKDIQIYETNPDWERLPEDMFKETRIIGWRRL